MVAQINMIGGYMSANFSAKADSNARVEIVDPMVPNGGSIAPGPAGTFPRNGIDLPDIAFGAQTTLAYSEDACPYRRIADGDRRSPRREHRELRDFGRRPWRHGLLRSSRKRGRRRC